MKRNNKIFIGVREHEVDFEEEPERDLHHDAHHSNIAFVTVKGKSTSGSHRATCSSLRTGLVYALQRGDENLFVCPVANCRFDTKLALTLNFHLDVIHHANWIDGKACPLKKGTVCVLTPPEALLDEDSGMFTPPVSSPS